MKKCGSRKISAKNQINIKIDNNDNEIKKMNYEL